MERSVSPRRPRLTVFAGFLIWATSVSAQQSNQEANRQSEKEIRATLADWVKANDAGDSHRANQIWAEDLVGYYPGQPDDTYEREIAAEKRPARPPATKTGLRIVEVIVSGDLGVVHDVWTFTHLNATPVAKDSIRGFEVWRKQPDGKWRIARWLSAPFPK